MVGCCSFSCSRDFVPDIHLGLVLKKATVYEGYRIKRNMNCIKLSRLNLHMFACSLFSRKIEQINLSISDRPKWTNEKPITPTHIVPSRMIRQCKFHIHKILQVNSNMQNALWALRRQGSWPAWGAMFDGKNCIVALQSLAPCNTAVETLFHTGETELVNRYVCTRNVWWINKCQQKESPNVRLGRCALFRCFRPKIGIKTTQERLWKACKIALDCCRCPCPL